MATIFLDYFYWHYAIAPVEILKIMRNYMTASWHRFLITQHLKTLFAPWHRQNPSDFGKKERNFGDRILDFLADIYIRLIAAGIRLSIILIGLIWQVIIFIIFITISIMWLAWPLIAVYSVIMGFNIVYTSIN